MGGFRSQSAFSSTGWTGGTYVSTGEQLGAWTDIKATHAWGNLFYNSSRKAAYASLRCSSLGAIGELKQHCALEMLINMNLCPDGFYLVYGHAEPPCSLPLPRGWDMNLGAAVAMISVQKVVCEEAGILSCSQSSWCGCGCVAAAGVLPHSCSSGDVVSWGWGCPSGNGKEGERKHSEKWGKGRIKPGQRLWISNTWLFHLNSGFSTLLVCGYVCLCPLQAGFRFLCEVWLWERPQDQALALWYAALLDQLSVPVYEKKLSFHSE